MEVTLTQEEIDAFSEILDLAFGCQFCGYYEEEKKPVEA